MAVTLTGDIELYGTLRDEEEYQHVSNCSSLFLSFSELSDYDCLIWKRCMQMTSCSSISSSSRTCHVNRDTISDDLFAFIVVGTQRQITNDKLGGTERLMISVLKSESLLNLGRCTTYANSW